jgi:hypothetical protein
MTTFQTALQTFLQQYKDNISYSLYLQLDIEFENNGEFCPPLIQLMTTEETFLLHYLELNTHKTIESYTINIIDIPLLTNKILEMINTYSITPIELRIFNENGIMLNKYKIK